MRTKHLCVLINIRIKGEVGIVGTVPRQYFFVDFFYVFVFAILSCLFLASLWSPAGKGLISWLSCM